MRKNLHATLLDTLAAVAFALPVERPVGEKVICTARGATVRRSAGDSASQSSADRLVEKFLLERTNLVRHDLSNQYSFLNDQNTIGQFA